MEPVTEAGGWDDISTRFGFEDGYFEGSAGGCDVDSASMFSDDEARLVGVERVFG